MRRRTWYMVETFDLLYSFQYGMPTAIHDEDMDVLPPKNLADDDFDETTAVLPPERPFSEFTQALYFAFKSRTIRLLRRVIPPCAEREDCYRLRGHIGPGGRTESWYPSPRPPYP